MEKTEQSATQIQRVLLELRHSALPVGYEDEESIYRVPEEWQKRRREAKKDGDRLKDSIPLSLRVVTQPERVQQTRNIDEPGGSEQKRKKW
jgi:hypothetical protein